MDAHARAAQAVFDDPIAGVGEAVGRQLVSGGHDLVGSSDELEALEQQRESIAMELHDGLLQQVTGARMQLESLLASGKIPPGAGRAAVENAAGLLRQAAAEARHLIQGLRPPALGEQGMLEAIRSLVSEPHEAGPQTECRAEGYFDDLDPQVETAVYRMIQEALTNVRRHSKSQRAEVRLVRVGDRLEIVVEDWGVGFDPTQIERKGTRFGLGGIVRRAQLLGGRAEAHSAPGQGTRIEVHLPLRSPRDGNRL